MKFVNPLLTSALSRIFWILLALGAAGCALDPSMSSQNRLQQNILLYNSQFESKMIEGSAKLVLWDQRNKFIRDALAITEKINFYDSSIVGMSFFKNGEPAKMTDEGPEEGFDQALVTMRYQLIVSPSNQLKTLFVIQEWILQDDEWYVNPNLEVYFQ